MIFNVPPWGIGAPTLNIGYWTRQGAEPPVNSLEETGRPTKVGVGTTRSLGAAIVFRERGETEGRIPRDSVFAQLEWIRGHHW